MPACAGRPAAGAPPRLYRVTRLWQRARVSRAEPRAELADAVLVARKRLVARTFAAAAETYDQHARVQRAVAAELAERTARLPLPAAPRVLEIGCGTGFLTALLLRRFPAARLLATDLAEAMVTHCRRKLGAADRGGAAARAAYAVMDGEWPALRPAQHELVLASLAFQWFAELAPALARLVGCLAPGGTLLFATLGADTFREWRAAHAALGLRHGVPSLPSADALLAALPAGGVGAPARVDEAWHELQYPRARDFLTALRAAGAHLPAPGYRPLPSAQLRAVLAALERGGPVRITYHVLYAAYTAPARPAAACP